MWVKICGVRDVAAARGICAAGADAIGLNFYSPSPRSVNVDTAREIVKSLDDSVSAVGLFVNHEQAEVFSIARNCGLKVLQFHGDETPEYLAEFQGFDLIRAFRIGDGNFAVVDRYLSDCHRLGISLWGCLIDACLPGSYGGTGTQADWEALAQARQTHWPRLILAGGLTPKNVEEAIRQVRPWGVDTASGVESAPGEKVLTKVEEFIRQAKQATGG